MGNVLLDDYKKDDPMQSFQKWLEQNPQLTGKQLLTQNKLFLTSRFTYNSKNILLKVHFKRDNSPIAGIIKSFQILSTAVNQLKCINILPLTILNAKQSMQKKDVNLIIATRQYIAMTLQDKLLKRPYMTLAQKKWTIFQMILSVDMVHNYLKLYHGNIRTSNFLITTYDYLILTDFANYKPTFILQDTEQGLAEFRLFYPSSLQKCNLAPEKLQGRSQSGSKLNNKPQYLFNLYMQYDNAIKQSSIRSSNLHPRDTDPKRQPSQKNIIYTQHMDSLEQMDLFSLGLSILQVLNDGKNTFTYENLLNLKKSKLNLEELIDNAIANQITPEMNDSALRQVQLIKDIVTSLLIKKTVDHHQQQPESLIQRFKQLMKDEIFVLLWYCLSSFSKISFQLADHRIYLLQSIIEFIQKEIKFSQNKFTMKRAKCLENFAALKIFADLIRKKVIFHFEIQKNTLLGQILSSIEKKDSEVNQSQPDQDMKLPQNNKRQSFFINESKQKSINRRLSFVSQPHDYKLRKILCPPQADNYLQKLVQQRSFDTKFSKLNLQQRKKTKLQIYLQKIKTIQHIREQLKNQRSYFYAEYQLVIKIIFSCIRNCQYVASRMLGIQLINVLGRQSSDRTLLRVVLPYLMNLSQDSDVNVAKYAFNSLLDTFYNFIDPFETEEDIAYYHMLLEFFVNTIKGSNIRIFMFSRFEEIYNICEWLQVVYLRIHAKFMQLSSHLTQSTLRTSVRVSLQKHPQKASLINFYRLVDQLKVSYGTFTARQIQQLMQNIPIAILPQMIEFYISFLNTQKIKGLKCSLFIAQNATKQFQMQRYIIDVFDNCLESGLCDSGVALCYSIKYFTLRRNFSLDIVLKIAPHIIHPDRWIRDQAMNYLRMCVQQFPPAKIFFLFRDVFDPPFPLTAQNLTQPILLPQPLREIDVNFKDRRYTNKISRPIGLTEKRFAQYLKDMKPSKQQSNTKSSIDQWENQTRRLRVVDNSGNNQGLSKLEVDNFMLSMKKTVQRLYQNNFFFYGFALSMKYNPAEKQQGLATVFDNLKKVLKLNLDSAVVSQEQRQFFESLFTTINLNFEKLLTKMSLQMTPDKLKLSLCINLIAQQLYMLHQIRVKPTLNFGLSAMRTNFQRNFKPKGIQVSQIYQNKQTISDIIKVGDYFFISGSHDGTMKVYDTRSIEMNIITEAEAIYQLKPDINGDKVKITTLTCLENTYTAVIGTNKGKIKGIQIQRMPSKLDNKSQSSRYIKIQNQVQLFKYTISGDIQKLVCPRSPQFSECIAYVTSQSMLGVQDIRCKDLSMRCNVGKQRGYCLSLSSNDNFCLLVGTVDGYLLTYDIRFNLVSSVLQLYKESQALPITNIIKLKNENKFCITYPNSTFQFAEFSNLDSSQIRLQPSRLYTGTTFTPNHHKQDQTIPSIPYFQNRTNDEVFKLCNNNLEKHIYYSQLSNFDQNYKILDYVSEPLTLKQSRIREMWANGCRHRYNQVLSIYNKKCVPFVQYFPGGILTCFNPNADTLIQRSDTQTPPKDLTFLTEKRQSSTSSSSSNITTQIDRQLITRNNKIKISQFDQSENKDYLTSCAVVNGFVAVSNRNSRIKIYR